MSIHGCLWYNLPMDRILIMGIPGAGKSTFTNKLGTRLNREVIHLDKLYYESGWKHIQTKEQWRQTVHELISKDKWILDGNYRGTLDIRLPRASAVILFNFNKLICFYRIFKRALKKEQPFDKAEGNIDKVSASLIKKVIKFPQVNMLEMVNKCRDTKRVFVVNNQAEADKLLEELAKQ